MTNNFWLKRNDKRIQDAIHDIEKIANSIDSIPRVDADTDTPWIRISDDDLLMLSDCLKQCVEILRGKED